MADVFLAGPQEKADSSARALQRIALPRDEIEPLLKSLRESLHGAQLEMVTGFGPAATKIELHALKRYITQTRNAINTLLVLMNRSRADLEPSAVARTALDGVETQLTLEAHIQSVKTGRGSVGSDVVAIREVARGVREDFHEFAYKSLEILDEISALLNDLS